MRPRFRLLAIALVMLLAGCGQPGAPVPTTAVGGADAALDAHGLFEATLAQLDTNHNGAIEASEARGSWLGGDFMSFDRNHDGHLDASEFAQAFGGTGARAAGLGFGALIGGVALSAAMGAYLTYAGLKGAGMIMHPDRDTFSKAPDAYGDPYERVTFKSFDGLTLVGWYVPAAVKTTKGILLLHGHGSDKDVAFKKYGQWLHQKYNLFVYDQRYCGESQGSCMTLGDYETKDALIALGELRSRGNTSLGVMGESLGGAVAVDVAAQAPDIKAVVEDCAFDSMHDAVAPRAKLEHYPFPDLVADAVVEAMKLHFHTDLTQADPIRWVAKIAPRPLLVIHGLADDETTPMNGQKLFAAAQDPKQAFWVPGAKHADSWEVEPDAYKQRVFALFDKAL